MRASRTLTPPACPKCKRKGFIQPEEAKPPQSLKDADQWGYVKCDVCGGEGSIWPDDIDQSRL